jgi:hypothetical protein
VPGRHLITLNKIGDADIGRARPLYLQMRNYVVSLFVATSLHQNTAQSAERGIFVGRVPRIETVAIIFRLIEIKYSL